MTWTVFGSSGFIGSELVQQLRRRGETVFTPHRGQLNFDHELGHVIYAIGLTADFRQHLAETVEAHVGVLNRLLSRVQFTSFLYLSSTRVYQQSGVKKVDENTELLVKPDLDGVYNLSKLLGEALCLAHDNERVRVARLSNVYANNMSEQNFLGMVLKAAVQGGAEINQSADSAKDYIDLEQASYWLLQIAERGKQRLYNVCSGELTSHLQIANGLNALLPNAVRCAKKDVAMNCPVISNHRVRDEFPAVLSSLTEQLPSLFYAAQKRWSSAIGVAP